VLDHSSSHLALARLLQELEGSAHGRLAHDDVEIEAQSRDNLGARDVRPRFDEGLRAKRDAEILSVRKRWRDRNRRVEKMSRRTLMYSSSQMRSLGGLLRTPVCARGAIRPEVVNSWTIFLTVLYAHCTCVEMAVKECPAIHNATILLRVSHDSA
jgi:hypothetical protein